MPDFIAYPVLFGLLALALFGIRNICKPQSENYRSRVVRENIRVTR